MFTLPENMSLFYTHDLSKKNHSRATLALRHSFSWNRRVAQGLRGIFSLPSKNKRERKMKLHMQIYSEQ